MKTRIKVVNRNDNETKNKTQREKDFDKYKDNRHLRTWPRLPRFGDKDRKL